MQVRSIRKRAAQGLILLSALAILWVSGMAFVTPQAVMSLVGVKLPNTDAYSSIRGAYGGVGLTLVISLLYLMARDIAKGLIFLSLLWGSYALSRTITILVEGTLGTFGQTWLIIESCLCLLSLLLLRVYHQEGVTPSAHRHATRG